MSRQRDRFYGSAKSGANSNELLPLRVDPVKPTTPFSQKISSKEEIPKISSTVVTQSQIITPVPTPTMPVQSHSLPSDINKKRSSDMHRESYPPDKASKKKSKPNTKRRASVSNELHDEKSTRKGLMQEGFYGTFQTSTNFDNGDRDGQDAPKDFAAIDGDRKRSLQEVMFTCMNCIAHLRTNSVSASLPWGFCLMVINRCALNVTLLKATSNTKQRVSILMPTRVRLPHLLTRMFQSKSSKKTTMCQETTPRNRVSLQTIPDKR